MSPRSTKARRTCKVCGLVMLSTYPEAERHMDSHGGGRLEQVPDDPEPSGRRENRIPGRIRRRGGDDAA